MADDEKDCLHGKDKASLQTVGLDEKERLLAELQDLLEQLVQGGVRRERDPDWSFSNFSFGLGIDPNG